MAKHVNIASALAPLAGAALLLSSCTERSADLPFDPLSSFKVEIVSGATGSEESPLPFEPAGAPYTLQVTAIGSDGLPRTEWSGPVNVTAEPGEITGTMNVVNGTANATVTLEKAFGVTRIWVEDPASYATGVTDAIHFRGPRIADVQTSTTVTRSPFEGERVPVDVESSLVVVGIARDGFYVTDTGIAGGEWASVYAFTFSAPRNLSVGDRITNLTGRVSEFLGFTELVHPSWEVVGTLPLPAPAPVTCNEISQANPNLTMEKLEAGLIEVTNATVEVCSSFPNCPDYDEYRQWTLDVGGCGINTLSRFSLAGFDPVANVGKSVQRMAGTLRHIQFAQPQWILEPRGPEDVCCPTCTPAYNQGC